MPGEVIATHPDGSPRLTLWRPGDPDHPLGGRFRQPAPPLSWTPEAGATATPVPEPPPMPGLLRRLLNYARSTARHVAAGMPGTPADLLEARLATCAACDRLDAEGVCRACGCPVVDKAARALESCPLGKWPAVADPVALPDPDDRPGLAERVELLVLACDYRTGPICGHGCGARWRCWQGKSSDPERPGEVAKPRCYQCVLGRDGPTGSPRPASSGSGS